MTPETLAQRPGSALLASLQRREQSAVEQIYGEYGGVSFGYLMRVLRDRSAAEDVQQQVFTEVWRRGPDYDPERGGLLTWIMQIARSRAIDHLRKRVPEPVDPTDKKSTEIAVADESIEELHEDWQISFLLKKLPHDEAQILQMRFVDDKSQTEIAAQTGIPLGTVKMRMVQGLTRLRDYVDDERRPRTG